ncbi:MAG: hypothetical protein ABIR79_13560 [Candidatus Binatia bacterium]
MIAIGAALLALVVLGTPARAVAAPFVDYLCMEPNEGGSSAGHVALALGDRTWRCSRYVPRCRPISWYPTSRRRSWPPPRTPPP